MSLSSLFTPFLRHKIKGLILVVVFAIALEHLVSLVVPDQQRTTLYFSVKPASQAAQGLQDPPESSMKIAEMIAGWAKTPTFRDKVLQDAGVSIDHFKRKLSAKKQNRANVFWTLKLLPYEKPHRDRVVTALQENIAKGLQAYNKNNLYPFRITPIEVSSEDTVIPVSWKWAVCVIFGFLLSLLGLHGFEVFGGRIGRSDQALSLFPGSPLFFFRPRQKKDRDLWERFAKDQPISHWELTCPTRYLKAYPFLKHTPLKKKGLPVIVVKLGVSPARQLENMRNLYTDKDVVILVLS